MTVSSEETVVAASTAPTTPEQDEDKGEGPSHSGAGSDEPDNADRSYEPQREQQGGGAVEGREAGSGRAKSLNAEAKQATTKQSAGDGAAPTSTSAPGRAGADDRPPSPSMALSNPDTTNVVPAAVPSAPPFHRSPTQHLDLATFPTAELLKLLASLLQQMAHANDALRPDSSSMTADEATGLTLSAQAGEARQIASGLPTRSVSGSSSTHSRRAYSAESLVIPPFKPKNSEGKFATVQPPAASELPISAAPAAEKTEAAAASTPSVVSRQSLQAPQPPAHRSNSAAASPYPSIFTASRQSINHPSSILCFHARNIPSISIEAYLQRILKYCPITNEVFLSLLVYFDRMSRQHVGNGVVGTSYAPSQVPADERSRSNSSSEGGNTKGFAIDSYNVHRLVIAGITVASKFFSDVFYTNSRYAKVSLGRLVGLHDPELMPATGRRFTTIRIESTGAPIPASQRLSSVHTPRGDAALRRPATSLLGEQAKTQISTAYPGGRGKSVREGSSGLIGRCNLTA